MCREVTVAACRLWRPVRYSSRNGRESGMPYEELLAALVRAIACDLIKLGYRPTATRGYLQQGDEPIRLVAEEVWRAMNEIIDGDDPGAAVAQVPLVKKRLA